MGNEQIEQNEPVETTEQTESVEPQEPESTEPEPTEPTDDDVLDKHGKPGINAEKYKRDMEAKDAKIKELEDKIAEAAKTEEGKAALQKEIDDLKASQADERLTHKLEMAGCKNVKAAKALLEDFDNDIEKLKSETPYLFEEEKKPGSTGLKPDGAAGDKEKRLNEARKLAGIRTKE